MQQQKSSDSLDATPPTHTLHAHHNKNRLPIHRFTVGEFCGGIFISQYARTESSVSDPQPVARQPFLSGPVMANCTKKFNHWRTSCQVIYSQFGLAIHQNDHQARRRFVEWAQNEIAGVPDFHKRILFSEEAHFWWNGYVNKQNCRIWSEANPQVYVKTPLHPEKLTVWCALYAGGIIGPYFFKNDEGHNVTVNGDRYRAMITNFFIPELNNHDVQELWFQQDGATCHTARATIDL
ncbi:uncharacterized protein TNCV_4843051 [Trichonephila clavipes]|uniref:Transposase n=1 Tax=Trichonephila clavipes TaxID=2585209 RepID=A0A8X6WIZ1_TRICX|nr:uncharacterized protein TNCV_4843051 [Trichonephila clavipes]